MFKIVMRDARGCGEGESAVARSARSVNVLSRILGLAPQKL
jgi:hypothetical protein